MMEDNYQYRVFIKSTNTLSGQKKKKIEQYFQLRRRSGGGECGPLTDVADNTYCVAFKDQKAQQEVLERREHTVKLSDGPLVFIVSDSPPTPSSPTNSFSTDPAQNSTSEERSLAQLNNDNDRSNSTIIPNDQIRIVILGKTGSGKSSLANTLIGETVFNPNHSAVSGTQYCQAASTMVNGKRIKLIDTPGFFDTARSDQEMKDEILKCLIQSAPGPHVFIIVLRVSIYTKEDMELIVKITKYFSGEALQFTTVLFTYGEQLPEGTTIEEFVSKSKDLDELVKKCGGRCNVIDNSYWKTPQDDYRNNEFQVKELLNTIDRIIEENNGHHYVKELQETLNTDKERKQERFSMRSYCYL